VHQRIYFTDIKHGSGTAFLGTVPYRSAAGTDLIDLNGLAPHGVGLDLQNGVIYWAQTLGTTGIYKNSTPAAFDFSNPAAITATTQVVNGAGINGVELHGTIRSTSPGTFDSHNSLSTVPLTDTFDSTKLQFVSASIAPTSVVGNVITWNNI